MLVGKLLGRSAGSIKSGTEVREFIRSPVDQRQKTRDGTRARYLGENHVALRRGHSSCAFVEIANDIRQTSHTSAGVGYFDTGSLEPLANIPRRLDQPNQERTQSRAAPLSGEAGIAEYARRCCDLLQVDTETGGDRRDELHRLAQRVHRRVGACRGSSQNV